MSQADLLRRIHAADTTRLKDVSGIDRPPISFPGSFGEFAGETRDAAETDIHNLFAAFMTFIGGLGGVPEGDNLFPKRKTKRQEALEKLEMARADARHMALMSREFGPVNPNSPEGADLMLANRQTGGLGGPIGMQQVIQALGQIMGRR